MEGDSEDFRGTNVLILFNVFPVISFTGLSKKRCEVTGAIIVIVIVSGHF